MDEKLIVSVLLNLLLILSNLYVGRKKYLSDNENRKLQKELEDIKKENQKELENYKLKILEEFGNYKELSEIAAKIESLIGSMISVANGNDIIKEETLKKYNKYKEEFRLFKESKKPFFPETILNIIEDFYNETGYFYNRVYYDKGDEEWSSFIKRVEGKKEVLMQTYNKLMNAIRKNTQTLQT